MCVFHQRRAPPPKKIIRSAFQQTNKQSSFVSVINTPFSSLLVSSREKRGKTPPTALMRLTTTALFSALSRNVCRKTRIDPILREKTTCPEP